MNSASLWSAGLHILKCNRDGVMLDVILLFTQWKISEAGCMYAGYTSM